MSESESSNVSNDVSDAVESLEEKVNDAPVVAPEKSSVLYSIADWYDLAENETTNSEEGKESKETEPVEKEEESESYNIKEVQSEASDKKWHAVTGLPSGMDAEVFIFDSAERDKRFYERKRDCVVNFVYYEWAL